MSGKSIRAGFPVLKPLDSKVALLETPSSDTADASPTIGGTLPTAGGWRLLEGKPGASPISAEPPARESRPAPSAPTTKLLIVDGDTAQMKILCDSLEPHGYSATCMTSAVEALAALREQPFDLV